VPLAASSLQLPDRCEVQVDIDYLPRARFMLRAAWARWEKEIGEPRPGREDPSYYAATIQKERGRLVQLIRDCDYDPCLAIDIGGSALFAWLDILQAEGKRSAALNELVAKLSRTTYQQQVSPGPVRDNLSAALKELVKCETQR
jgi:hypothetical protein